MLSLLFTILATACIFLAFKSFKVFGMNSLHAIIVNYLTCVVFGFIFLSDKINYLFDGGEFKVWYVYAIFLGFLFIITFLRMSRTAQEISVTASSMASKLALVLPVVFSLFVLQRAAKDYDYLNYIGIVITVPALLLASWPDKSQQQSKIWTRMALPFSVFIFSGIIDTALNYFNAIYEDDPAFVFFPILVFLTAGLSGLAYSIISPMPKVRWKTKSILGGIYLGIPNFFSLYFLLVTLKLFNQDGAFIFPFSNLGTILLSTLAAFVLFRERMNWVKISGLFLAGIAIVLLAYQEFMNYLNL